MMNKKTSNLILDILNDLIPNPICELNYNNIYELTCAVCLSAQTLDKRVNEVTPSLFIKYPSIYDLKDAEFDDVYRIVKPLGFAANKANNLIGMANMVVNEYDGIIPSDMKELIKLPGVGRKTASVILAVGFNIPAFPVDTHIKRMSHRLGYANEYDDVLTVEKKFTKYIDKEQWNKAHHLFLLFGRYYCKAKKPECENCKLINFCKKK